MCFATPTVLQSAQGSVQRKVRRMKIGAKAVALMALIGIMTNPISAGANNLQSNLSNVQVEVPTTFMVSEKSSTTKIVKVLSDHPGAATALTAKQKSQIRRILIRGKANRNFICTGISLPRQSESMYRVVLLRAQLVCRYAKSIDPTIKTTVKERLITSRNLNGRVEVVSK
jgi:hypothetical protein